MTHRTNPRALLPMLALLVTALSGGCNDPLSPAEVRGVYEATRFSAVDAETRALLPRFVSATLVIDESQITRRIEYGSFAADGTVSVIVHEMTMDYEIDGARLRTNFDPCLPGEDCSSSITTADYFVFGDELEEIGTALTITYRRVQP